MRIFLTFLTTVCLFSCSSKENIEVIETFPNGNPKLVKMYLDRGDSSNYVFKEYYEDGTIFFEGKVSNNKFIEYKRSYYSNGKPKEFVKLADSADLNYCCPNGFYKIYYKNGILQEDHHKKEGNFNGLVIQYDTSGNKLGAYPVSNDLRNGVVKTFHSNGAISSLKEYRNDTLIGAAYYFNEYGDTLKRQTIFKGEVDFPVKYWKENGSSLAGEYYNDDYYYKVRWAWRDSTDIIIKEEIVDTVKGQFIIPDF